eukprot:scaffold232_cov374-Prasinococcus_capsulatus_cf.AAC.4
MGPVCDQVYYQRNLLRQQQQQQQWLQKRRQENAQRRANGEAPLPEEDPNNPIFKAIPEPSKLDGMPRRSIAACAVISAAERQLAVDPCAEVPDAAKSTRPECQQSCATSLVARLLPPNGEPLVPWGPQVQGAQALAYAFVPTTLV